MCRAPNKKQTKKTQTWYPTKSKELEDLEI